MAEGFAELAPGVSPDYRSPDRELLERVARGEQVGESALRLLRRRKLVRTVEDTRTLLRLSEDVDTLLSRATVEIGALTADLIRSGVWRRYRLKRYDITAAPPRLRPARFHVLAEFIDYLRDVMREMGFVEVEHPAIELEFWNYDALFQPQFHPARSPTDTFYVAKELRLEEPPAELARRVAEVHERAWRYRWSLEAAERLILRSHTTAVSARLLWYIARTGTRPPFRFFTVGRVYRVEKVDPKHLPEFHQLDGIASEEEMGFRDLLGILAEFFERIGIREYRFRLAYFPFTEPSAEAYVRVRGEWIEVLGCGMFRPEVLEPFGIDYPVAAWGMGIERLVMSLYGVSDIRDLYSYDVSKLEAFNGRWARYAGTTVQEG